MTTAIEESGPRLFDKCEVDACLARGPCALAYDAYSRWLDWWHETHPDDERNSFDLIDEYAAWYSVRPEWPYLEREPTT